MPSPWMETPEGYENSENQIKLTEVKDRLGKFAGWLVFIPGEIDAHWRKNLKGAMRCANNDEYATVGGRAVRIT